MGIRFFCPNGHKLNVKEHLAGKAGFCPECGARLIIPLQSTRKSSKELNELKGRQEKESLGNAPNVNTVPVSSATPAHPKPLEINSASASTNVITTPAPISNPDEITNPILQDQTVVWYVQVLGGERYGPVNGQTIHSWIQERRIEPSMLIWREGWTNWLEAKNVFTELEVH
ncbi:MAG: DUF4339 domain-containing protein [Planctomycetaceae bacterium]|jgi:hypothetical protein|nr:DUF4339 domain-containing protein [Planctomycetaceae bacterium]